MSNLTEQTPQQIDEQLARIYGETARLSAQRYQALETAAHYFKNIGKPGYGNAEEVVEEYQAKAAELAVKLYELGQEAAPLNDEFDRRGGWTRAFLVNNSNGHVHRNMACSTCFLTTEYCWLTELSDHDEAEIVELAGERACTVCYPTAPVATLSRPTQLFTPDEKEKAKAREERAQKAAQRDAAKVFDPETGKELFKTERGCSNAILVELDSMVFYGTTHPSYDEWAKNVLSWGNALAAKRGGTYQEVYDELRTKALKKGAREYTTVHPLPSARS